MQRARLDNTDNLAKSPLGIYDEHQRVRKKGRFESSLVQICNSNVGYTSSQLQQMAIRHTIRLCRPRHHAGVGVLIMLAVLCFVQLTGEFLLLLLAAGPCTLGRAKHNRESYEPG
jgi:hypothetical protein